MRAQHEFVYYLSMPGQNERFGGLPDVVADKAAKALAGTYTIGYTLPKKLVGMRWTLEDQYLQFSFSEMSPKDQHQAAKIAKDNPSVLQQELMFVAICTVGDKPTSRDRDFLEKWWLQIGPRLRMLVTTAFGEQVSVDEEETAMFLATREDTAQ